MKKTLTNKEALEQFLLQHGEKPYRVKQIEHAIYKEYVQEVGEMTALPQVLRDTLAGEFSGTSLELYRSIRSQDDQTEKFLFRTHDGLLFETVLMYHLKDRITVCVSSQAGCAVGCTFCATGKLGLKRNLYYYEIIDQLLHCQRIVHKQGKRVRNVVFMGMGEPLHNYGQVKRSIELMIDPHKMGLGRRHVTLSTCGIIAGIRRMIEDKLLVNLAISLHAPNDVLRTSIMPINETNKLEDLMAILARYSEATGKRIFYEYIMLEGVNDREGEAKELAELLQGTLAHVNLIPFNAPEKKDDFAYQRSSRERMHRFQELLQERGIPSTIRVSLGQDIAAACGQLALETKQ